MKSGGYLHDPRHCQSAARHKKKLSKTLRIRINETVKALADNPRPRGAEKIKGVESLYRLRIGDYRILYAVHDPILLILVVTVGHRKEVHTKKLTSESLKRALKEAILRALAQ